MGAGLTFAVSAQVQSARYAPSSDRFYEGREQGWFWYEPYPVEEGPELESPAPLPKPETKAEPQVTPPAPVAPTPSPVVTEPADDGPPPMSVAWMRRNLVIAKERAMDSPTEENIRAYRSLQRVMLDKAALFREGFMKAVMNDPVLNENNNYPRAQFGVNQVNDRVNRAKNEVVAALREKVGIWFFFQGSCDFCEIQAPVIKSFAERYGFVVLPISLDGQPLRNNVFPEFKTDAGQAAALGVQMTPTTVLAKPPDDFALVSQGLIAADELTTRVSEAAVEKGWVEPELGERTRLVNTRYYQPGPGTEIPKEIADDPAKLADHVRSLIKPKNFIR